MLFNYDWEITTDPKKIADILQHQFSSVFSDPNCPDVEDPVFSPPKIGKPSCFQEFVLKEEDIISAIAEISSDSASGLDGISARLLKNCAKELAYPIRLIWSECFHLEIVPQFYKDTCITPLFKKGDRAREVNYRPCCINIARNQDLWTHTQECHGQIHWRESDHMWQPT